MLNNKKYILQKTAKYALCTILAITVVNQAATLTNTSIPFTQEDLKNNEQYIQEVAKISIEKPEYKNKDLIVELFNQGIDIDHPETVKSITITNQLINQDFSDIKYFPNLTELIIENNNIDLIGLKYNYNLINLQIKNSTLTNTKDIPNSIYNLVLEDCIIEDNSFEIPYNTKYLTIMNSPFNNIYLKNPKQLDRLTIVGNTFLDLSAFKDCKKLENITLHRIANVINANVLTSLNAKLDLDNYIPIWMNKDTYTKLELADANMLKQVEQLDTIATTIIQDNMTNDEKVSAITTYILKLLKYDEDITKPELKEYNNNPLILKDGEGICINYASLFTALANRAGLDTYQIYSSDHTWNMVNDKDNKYFIDLSMLDTEVIIETLTEFGVEYSESDISSVEHINNNEESKLYHYHITLEELVNDSNLSRYTLLPEDNEGTTHNIGYISKKGFSIEYNNNLYFIEYSMINKLIIMLSLFTLSVILLTKKKDNVYKLK